MIEIALIDKYENFDNLTVAMLNEFVERILVHERDRKGSIETTQEIEIYFNFVGKYMPPHFGEVNLTLNQSNIAVSAVYWLPEKPERPAVCQ